jgi:hypothetical protein
VGAADIDGDSEDVTVGAVVVVGESDGWADAVGDPEGAKLGL